MRCAFCATYRQYTGHPGHGQRVEVAAGGALGELQLQGDLRRCHLLALLQQQEEGHKTVSSHPTTLPHQTGHDLTSLSPTMAA